MKTGLSESLSIKGLKASDREDNRSLFGYKSHNDAPDKEYSLLENGDDPKDIFIDLPDSVKKAATEYYR